MSNQHENGKGHLPKTGGVHSEDLAHTVRNLADLGASMGLEFKAGARPVDGERMIDLLTAQLEQIRLTAENHMRKTGMTIEGL